MLHFLKAVWELSLRASKELLLVVTFHYISKNVNVCLKLNVVLFHEISVNGEIN